MRVLFSAPPSNPGEISLPSLALVHCEQSTAAPYPSRPDPILRFSKSMAAPEPGHDPATGANYWVLPIAVDDWQVPGGVSTQGDEAKATFPDQILVRCSTIEAAESLRDHLLQALNFVSRLDMSLDPLNEAAPRFGIVDGIPVEKAEVPASKWGVLAAKLAAAMDEASSKSQKAPT